MITKIGLIAGEILTLLEKGQGPMNFNYFRSSLKETDYLVWMSLGCLLCERYINAIEKLSTVRCKVKNIGKIGDRSSLLFYENHENHLAKAMDKESAIMARHVLCVAAEIMSILEGFQGTLSFETIVNSLNEPKEDVLMAFGWLIRKAYVRSFGSKEIFVSRSPKETTDLNIESLCNVYETV